MCHQKKTVGGRDTITQSSAGGDDNKGTRNRGAKKLDRYIGGFVGHKGEEVVVGVEWSCLSSVSGEKSCVFDPF